MVDVLFCHGLESSPNARKAQALKEAGLEVFAPDFQGLDLAARVKKIGAMLRENMPAVVCGSSYGGIAALCAMVLRFEAKRRLCPLILCAPALTVVEAPADTIHLAPYSTTTIIHGLRDDVVPIDASRRFAAGQDNVELIEVEDGHALIDSLDVIVDATKRALAESRCSRAAHR
jgi:pimeloyl-ACP methyl ester carboxylesterase